MTSGRQRSSYATMLMINMYRYDECVHRLTHWHSYWARQHSSCPAGLSVCIPLGLGAGRRASSFACACPQRLQSDVRRISWTAAGRTEQISLQNKAKVKAVGGLQPCQDQLCHPTIGQTACILEPMACTPIADQPLMVSRIIAPGPVPPMSKCSLDC